MAGKKPMEATAIEFQVLLAAAPGRQRLSKGKKMPGQFGNRRKTAQNLKIVDINPDKNLIMLKGAVPGAAAGLVEIKKSAN